MLERILVLVVFVPCRELGLDILNFLHVLGSLAHHVLEEALEDRQTHDLLELGTPELLRAVVQDLHKLVPILVFQLEVPIEHSVHH